jgi:hypothetical protein
MTSSERTGTNISSKARRADSTGHVTQTQERAADKHITASKAMRATSLVAQGTPIFLKRCSVNPAWANSAAHEKNQEGKVLL